MTLKQIKILARDVIEFNDWRVTIDEHPIVDEYLLALRTLDYNKLKWFESFGETVRHRVMNINEWYHAKNLGFTEYHFDEYGWIDKFHFDSIENIAFEKKDNDCIRTYLSIAKSPNGKYLYGHGYSHGAGSGGGSSVNVFSYCFVTREECINHGVSFLKDKFNYASEQNDTTNYKQPYIKEVLKNLNNYLSGEQLKTDNKGQLLMF